MPRFPELDRDSMTEAQRAAYDAIASGPRGAVRGPFKVWLHRPEFCDRAQQVGAYCRYSSTLPPRLSELTIITMARFWGAEYEWFSHAPIAAKAGVSEAAIEAIRTGGTPVFEQEDEQALHAFVAELNQTHKVSDATYDRAVAVLGLDSVVDLVGIAGYYTLISMTLCAFEVKVPEGTPPPFDD